MAEAAETEYSHTEASVPKVAPPRRRAQKKRVVTEQDKAEIEKRNFAREPGSAAIPQSSAMHPVSISNSGYLQKAFKTEEVATCGIGTVKPSAIPCENHPISNAMPGNAIALAGTPRKTAKELEDLPKRYPPPPATKRTSRYRQLSMAGGVRPDPKAKSRIAHHPGIKHIIPPELDDALAEIPTE